MQEYVIAMKSGHSFRVQIKDFLSFISDLQTAINPQAINNFYAQGGVMFDVADVSAIYPLSAQQANGADAESKALLTGEKSLG
jgi:hypothetical protein